MTQNKNIAFHLTRGNPYSNSVGIGADTLVYGKSIGGKIFRKEIIANSNIIYSELKDGNQDLFDAIVPSDIIDSYINYRAIFITNYGVASAVLDTISISVIPNPIHLIQIADCDIAIEGVFTVSEVSRPIPVTVGKAENPSIYLDDEYDSTNKLAGMVFKKTLDADDLPTDIPYDGCVKIWIRRKMLLNKQTAPDTQLTEGILLEVKEYDSTNNTTLLTEYTKNEGRISLSNWYDWTIPFGKNTRISMREVIPKEVDISMFNIINVFTKDDKIILYYWTSPDVNSLLRNYAFMVIQPQDDVRLNKYINVFLEFENIDYLDTVLISDTIIDVKKSFYNPNHYYFFWAKNYLKLIGKCEIQYIGEQTEFDEVVSHILDMTIWTGNVFDNVLAGYANKRTETYNVLDRKLVRKNYTLTNVEQFEDLFIMFGQDTHSKNLKSLIDLNVVKNEILYVFEKDIIDSEKYTTFKHYQQSDIEVFAQRVFPQSIPTNILLTSLNNAKNDDLRVFISNKQKVSRDTYAPRRIKYLLDGTRYVDLNSFHHREFKIGPDYWTYELPTDDIKLTNVYVTTSFAIDNTEEIYKNKLTTYPLAGQISNIYGSETLPRAQFQQNIIDLSSTSSLSFPVEWQDRVYQDDWKTIFSTLPDQVDGTTFFTVQYNFARNLWKAIFYDANGVQKWRIYDWLDGQVSVTTSPTTGTPIGKDYPTLNIKDLEYVLEPDTYQPLTIQISTTITGTELKLVNYRIFFKGNETPIIDVITYAKDIRNICYLIFNPDQKMTTRLNYLEVGNANDYNVTYHVKSLHPIMLNKIKYNLSKEFEVNTQYRENQAEFKWYRKIDMEGFAKLTGDDLISSDISIPIILYGNGYKQDAFISPASNLAIKIPFDFSHIGLKDFSMRFFKESDMTNPLSFKLSKIDWDHDFAVIWLRLKDFSQDYRGSLYMFYGNLANTNVRSIFENYNYLKKDIYSNKTFGAWHFDNIIEDTRSAFVSGKVLNAGEPYIFEKASSGEMRLSQIDKEYMFGLAKVYKSHFFDLELKVPLEESLIFDPDKKQDFYQFIEDTTRIFKPSYTEINKITKSGIDILEVGGGKMSETMNKRVSGLVALTPNQNVNTYYDRTQDVKFNLLTSFNGYSESIDWVVSRPLDSSVFKSGVHKVNGKLKSDTIVFETPFKNTDYFIFISSPVNQKIYWNQLCPNRFNITASHFLMKEVSWMAFHRDIFGGINTPDSIFCGKRTLTGFTETTSGEPPSTPNLTDWYNSELWIKPEIGVEGDPASMSIDPTDPGYSVILSSNENINMYWTEKNKDSIRINTSSPAPCVVHWLVIRNGVEWWDEIV